MSYNATGLRFSAYSLKDRKLALLGHNVPWGKAQELLATGRPIHVPMNQRIRDLLGRRKNAQASHNARRRAVK